VVVDTEGGGLMVSENVFVPIAPTASVTVSVIDGKTPVAVGVPLKTPALLIVSPVGSVLPLSAKTSVPVPPLAVIVCEYGWLTVHGGSGVAVVMEGRGFTTSEYALVVDALLASVAFTENGYGVGTVTTGAVPLRAVPVKESQLGNPVIVRVTMPVPPVTVRVCE